MSNITEKNQIHLSLCNKIHKLYGDKNNDYGDSVHHTYERYGMDAFLVRMEDKLNRVYQLTRPNQEQKVNDEKIEDTLLDLANYALISLVEIQNEKNQLTQHCSCENMSNE